MSEENMNTPAAEPTAAPEPAPAPEPPAAPQSSATEATSAPDTAASAPAKKSKKSANAPVGAYDWLVYTVASLAFLGVAITLFCFFASAMGDVSDFVPQLSDGPSVDALIGAMASLLTMVAFGVGTVLSVSIMFFLARRAHSTSSGIMKLLTLGLVILPALFLLSVVVMVIVAVTMVF